MAEQSARLRLTGKQRKQLYEAILGAFRYDQLRRCIRDEMNEDATVFVRALVPFGDQVDDVLDWAQSTDRTKELIRALRACNDTNVGLKEAADALLPVDDLEKIVSKNPELFSDPDAWRQAMVRAEAAVCRVECPEGRACGSGFLVGPDLVLTNHHVKDRGAADFASNPGAVRFRFGFYKSAAGQPEGGKVFSLAGGDGPATWFVHESPTTQLDYALVRLSGRPGDEPVSAFPGAPRRGWLVPAATEPRVGQALFILQHPGGDLLKMANGGLKGMNGPWLEYEVDTEPGSSGSPVFDNRWQLVALHSRAGQGEINRGVSFAAILADLPPAVRSLVAAPRE